MKITLAKTAGFCFGVDRAVNMVYDLLDSGKKVSTLGPIIHNPQLVSELSERGVKTVNTPSEADADSVLVIRSHGVPEGVYSEAENNGLEVCDATCPFVAKIHKIVKECSENGDVVLVAGDEKHHEVIGILGHISGEKYVFSGEEELEEILKNHSNFEGKTVCVASQTTFNKKTFEKCCKILKKVCTNAHIFDTICNATSVRQQEAEELALSHDIMIVIGGRHSSNTAKLFDVCSSFCKNTYLIETAAELQKEFFIGGNSVGVIAGASTPAGIIKEVINTMEKFEPVNEQITEEQEIAQKSFEDMTDEEAFEASLSSLNDDKKVVGTVLAVTDTEVQVDYGRGLTGYVTRDEFSFSDVDLKAEVSVGDKINLIIMRTNDQEGTALLSKKRYDAIAGWDNIINAKESGEILNGTVTDVIKGAVIVSTEGARVFVPASLATLSRNESIEELKGTAVQFRVIEIGRGRRAVGSIKSVLLEAKKEKEAKVWESIAVGDRYTGTVKSLTSYGAFVDIGGVDGMVHISELSWSRIKNPSEVVLVGDTVEVYVKDIDVEKKKISLGYKKPEDNPWVIFNNTYRLDDNAEVTIVSLTSYGAFARIIPGVDGLIHISQIANKHVAKPQDELKVGETVTAKIIAIDDEKKRVSLSIRALLPEEPATEEVAEEVAEAPAAEEAPVEAAAEAPEKDAE